MSFKDLLTVFFLRHPSLKDLARSALTHKFVVNNAAYKTFVLKKANAYAQKYPQGVMGVAIENTINCNAKCIMCFHSVRTLTGTMSMDLFKKIVDDCVSHGITMISISVYGEPLVDPFFLERIEYLRGKNLNYGFLTNGQLLDNKMALALFKLGGLKQIHFSVCGYDKEVYEKIMPGLNRDVSYENIRNFLELKKRHKGTEPRVSVSTVKVNENKKDLRKYIKFWQAQKGVDFIVAVDLWDRAGDKDMSHVGRIDRCGQKNKWMVPCKRLWGDIIIYFDGRVAPCCRDNDLREWVIGDIRKQNLSEIYNSDEMNHLRRLHLEGKRAVHPMCGKCPNNSFWF